MDAPAFATKCEFKSECRGNYGRCEILQKDGGGFGSGRAALNSERFFLRTQNQLRFGRLFRKTKKFTNSYTHSWQDILRKISRPRAGAQSEGAYAN
ncbi:MAG: hypothetical protein DBX55_08255 [Verrucomicrobia bacterium]|nr:MAG: hypothetical protein DBX55_08255 [Verrucomicrobiota bacterium]